MKTLDIPVNKHLRFKKAAGNDDYILSLVPDERHFNHLGTIHASVLFALAEASSGEFLLNEFKEIINEVIPVVRKAEIKFSKPANGEVKSKVNFLNSSKTNVLNELNDKNRILAKVKVYLFDENNAKVLHSEFEWFIFKK